MPLPDVAAGDTITAAHINDIKDAAELVPDAVDIAFTPTGSIAATTVQAAIAEVASEASGGGSGAIGVGTSDPGSPASGDAYLNTSTRQLRVYDGADWWYTAMTRENLYALEVLADSPWGLWLLDETTGTTLADVSGHGRDMTLTGSAHTLDQTGPGSNLTKAIAFANATGHAEAAPTMAEPYVSHEGWVKIAAAPAGPTAIVSQAASFNSPTRDKGLFVDTDGKVGWHCYDGSTHTLKSPGTVTDGAWHHIVGTVGPAGEVIYIDGTQVAIDTGVVSGYTAESQKAMIRGGGDNNAGTGAITLAAGAVYTHQLSATRIAAHYAAV